MTIYDYSYKDLVRENNRRLNVIKMVGYNPVTGEGSLIPRIKIFKFKTEYCLFPAQMQNIDLVNAVLLNNSVEGYVVNVKKINKSSPKFFEEVNLVWYELLNHRLDEDFEFWASHGGCVFWVGCWLCGYYSGES